MLKEQLTAAVIDLMEKGRVPEFVTRAGIRKLCFQRLRNLENRGCEQTQEAEQRLFEDSIQGPVAHVPEKANEQHYEVPAKFYDLVLGQHRKYSSCYWDPSTDSLDKAEHQSLQMTCDNAGLVNGQRLLELGCGWGALSLFVLNHYPDCEVTAVSNSASQREYIYDRAEEAGVASRLTVITKDMNDFTIDQKFDRIISLEMFEHMRNYRLLLKRCSDWLTPEGALLVHVFCHRHFCYPFEEQGAANWMGRYFFSGGLMPSDQWFYRFNEDLRVTRQWRWNGTHYAKTADAWLENMAKNREALLPILAEIYPGDKPEIWYHRWRILFLAGSELFGARGGEEWWVSHYRFEQNPHRIDREPGEIAVTGQESLVR